MNIQEQKKYHERKLAIIEMIEICTQRIRNEKSFIRNSPSNFALTNTRKNISKYEKIREYLLNRYKN